MTTRWNLENCERMIGAYDLRIRDYAPTISALPLVNVGRTESTLGASGFRSDRRFEGARNTKTAMLKFGRFC